jgi:hypothetical protein
VKVASSFRSASDDAISFVQVGKRAHLRSCLAASVPTCGVVSRK